MLFLGRITDLNAQFKVLSGKSGDKSKEIIKGQVQYKKQEPLQIGKDLVGPRIS